MKLFHLLSLALLGLLTSASALAGGYYHGGYYGHGGHYYHGSSVNFGFYFGAPVFGPWWWYPPAPVYYGPTVVYREPVIVTTQPRVVESAPVQPAPSAAQNNGVVELGPAPNTPSQYPPVPAQPQSNAPQSQSAPQTLAGGQVYVYPRQGQNPQQQARDEGDCNRWAATQMGSGFSANQAAANFQRALAACMDAHGYSVR